MIALVLAAGLASVRPGVAAAQPGQFQLEVEAGGLHAADSGNSDLFGFGFGAAADVEWRLHRVAGLSLGLAAFVLTPSDSPDSARWFAARLGARIHFGVPAGLGDDDAWFDVHASLGDSGGIARGGLDVGVGYGFALSERFRVGPFLRYQWGSDPNGEDAHLVHLGVALGLFDYDHAAGAPDHDEDGVADSEDECPDVPAGARPDPAHPGCPTRDQDGDGVADADDQCPTTPAGAAPDAARPGCPGIDRDGDGITDGLDTCPDEHTGPHPDDDRAGCPAPDRDHDSVIDEIDRCPDEAGAPSRNADRNGCPGLVRVDASQMRILRPVFFASNREVILESSFPVLAAVVDATLALGVRRIRIEGHTDSRGRARHNLELSERRAASVRDWLIEHGVPADALESVGYGEERPLDSNRTRLGRAANRRVEFHIVDEEYGQ